MHQTSAQLVLTDSAESVDWVALAGVFVRAPLGTRSAQALEQVFKNSQVAVFAYDEARLVGAGRALTDRLNWTVVFDVVVEPEYQGRRLGTAIVERLASQAGARNVMLQAVPGKEPFYARLGYRSMTTAMAKYNNPEWAAASGYII